MHILQYSIINMHQDYIIMLNKTFKTYLQYHIQVFQNIILFLTASFNLPKIYLQHYLLPCQDTIIRDRKSNTIQPKEKGNLTKFLQIKNIQFHVSSQYKNLIHYKHDSTSGRLVLPRYAPVIHLQTVNPHSPHTNESSIMYDRVSPPETFLTSYISSCSHPIQTSFDSHHLVMIIYLIPITSRVRISIVIDQILK